jgi:MFS transporter, putative metabolite transport protein
MCASGFEMTSYEDAPLNSFHRRVAIAAAGGVFSDGFGLGIIGSALSATSSQLTLSPLWLGLLGGSSLAGLFLGALLTGPIADRFGRRPIFAYNMALLCGCSALQFIVDSPAQWLIIRLMAGILLGTDYVVSKALLAEFTPRRFRGRILGTLSIAWAAGYTCAYFAGYALSDIGADSWRWMLLTSAVPALLILPLRVVIPESPLWLVNHGHSDEATRVVHLTMGTDITPPKPSKAAVEHRRRLGALLSPPWHRRTLVACTLFTCQVIPYFAVGTFVSKVMTALAMPSSYRAGLLYNMLLLAGAVFGSFMVDRISRRSFLVGSFGIAATSLLILSVGTQFPTGFILVLFALFAGVLSSISSLIYVYLPELFPTELRASGIALAVSASRIGSAIATFLLPLLVVEFGVRATLAGSAGILMVGGIVGFAFAPETRGKCLDDLFAVPSVTKSSP